MVKYFPHAAGLSLFLKSSIKRKKDEETKGYGDYNWEELYKSGNLKKLKVAELNKYIFRHNLSRRKMSKSEKLNLLSAHTSPKVYAKGS